MPNCLFSPATFNTVSFSLHFSNCNYLGLRYGFLHILFIEFVKIFEYVELEFSSSLQLHHHNFYTICLHTSFWTPIIYICPQLLSCVRLFVTPWITARQAPLSITNSRSLLKFMSIKLVMPSSHLILCRPLLLLPPIPPSIRVFSTESTLPMRWPKYWSFSFSISLSNEHPGLISFRMDWLILLAVQGTLKSLLQHHSSKASILQCSAFFTVQLTSIHDHRKNYNLD